MVTVLFRLKKNIEQNYRLDNYSGQIRAKNTITKSKKKITGPIIGPAMAGPTGPFATALY